MKRVLAIDPGLSGAAVLYVGGAVVPVEPGGVIDLPTIDAGKQREIDGIALRDWMLQMRPDVAVVEQVQAMPSFSEDVDPETGKKTRKLRSMGAASAFNFGGTYRLLKWLPLLFNIPTTVVTPQRWKGHYGLKGGDGGKERARQLAIQKWPPLHELLARKRDHQRAEALLLAAYFYRHEIDEEIPS